MSTDDYVTINIHLGQGIEGKMRRAALERLAEAEGFFWGDDPSVGRWLVSQADEAIESLGMAFYAILSDNLNDPNSLQYIRGFQNSKSPKTVVDLASHNS